jgi:hypothetical protein
MLRPVGGLIMGPSDVLAVMAIFVALGLGISAALGR